MDSEPDLARDRLGDRDVVRAPGGRLSAVECEERVGVFVYRPVRR